MPAALPGEMKTLRRLGRNKSGDANGCERRKRERGAWTPRQSFTENNNFSNTSKVMQLKCIYLNSK